MVVDTPLPIKNNDKKKIIKSEVDMSLPISIINNNNSRDDDEDEDEDDYEDISVIEIIINKKKYYCDQYGIIYDFKNYHIVGKYEINFNSLIPIFK